MPVTDREKRRTDPAKVILTPAGVPEANLTVPTRVSGGGSSSLTLSAVADAVMTSPSPVAHTHACYTEFTFSKVKRASSVNSGQSRAPTGA